MRTITLLGVALFLTLCITLYRATPLREPFPHHIGSSTGVNLPDLSAAGPIFIDAMKQAAPWTSRQRLIEDADGNIVALRRGQVAETVLFKTAAYPGGTYTLLYDGIGKFDILPRSGSVLSRSRGRMLMSIVPHRGYGIRLRLVDVDTLNHPRNIRLLLPGYGGASTSQLFYPAFLRAARESRVIRYADWMHANTYAVSTVWPRRTTTHAFTQAVETGVAIEYMIAVANASGATPWFTIPVGATDYWIENFTALLAEHLDPRLHPLIEYGDEVWRTGSPANRYATMAAHNVGLHGNALAWYSHRSVRVFQLVGQGLAGKQFVRVLSGPIPDGGNAEIDRSILAQANAGHLSDAFAVASAADKSLRVASGFAHDAGLQLLSYSKHFESAHHARDVSLHLQPAHMGPHFIFRRPLPGRPS